MSAGGERAFALLACLVGYHARAGIPLAMLDHTYTDRILDVRLDGQSVGERGLNAALAGSFGVPVALVTGDAALAREAEELLGGAVRTVAVKEAASRQVEAGALVRRRIYHPGPGVSGPFIEEPSRTRRGLRQPLSRRSEA